MRTALALVALICGVASAYADTAGPGEVDLIESYCSKAGKIVLYNDKGMMSFMARNKQDNFRYIDNVKSGPFGEVYRPVNGGKDEVVYRAESVMAAASPDSSKLVIFRDRVFWSCK